jgi:hypothetical protein
VFFRININNKIKKLNYKLILYLFTHNNNIIYIKILNYLKLFYEKKFLSQIKNDFYYTIIYKKIYII